MQRQTMVNPEAIPTIEGVTVCPGAAGGKEWNAMAYSPVTQMVYVPAIENCAKFVNNGVEAKRQGLPPGESGSVTCRASLRKGHGDPRGDRRHCLGGEDAHSYGRGMLATAGGLVFAGDPEGNFTAYDADRGDLLWSYQTGSGIRAAPIAYQLDGKQYIAIASGMGGAVGGFTGAGAPWMKNYRTGNSLHVFRLFEPGASTAFHGAVADKLRRFFEDLSASDCVCVPRSTKLPDGQETRLGTDRASRPARELLGIAAGLFVPLHSIHLHCRFAFVHLPLGIKAEPIVPSPNSSFLPRRLSRIENSPFARQGCSGTAAGAVSRKNRRHPTGRRTSRPIRTTSRLSGNPYSPSTSGLTHEPSTVCSLKIPFFSGSARATITETRRKVA